MKKILLLLVLLTGCSSIERIFSPPTTTERVMEVMEKPVMSGEASCSPILGWLGGVCCLGGIALLMLTGGRMGWRPLIGGIGFVVLNYALALYASWFFIPVVIATAAISLAWAGKIVYKIVNDDNIKFKETKL